ncbi:DUF4124 domain-containing protein [Lysobacter sp. A289]
MHRPTWPSLFGIVALALASPSPASGSDGISGKSTGEITIYRCTDGQGRLSLRDTPCANGQQQQRVDMVRPRDPPPRPVADAATTTVPTTVTSTTAQASPQVIVIQPPQPVYECVTHEGERYTSDNPAGNPRWVPLWTLGYPVYPRPVRVGRPGHHSAVTPHRPAPSGRQVSRFKFDSVGRPTPEPSRSAPGLPVPPPMAGLGISPGSWISDQCHRLPQDQVCNHLRDRRWELGRRYNSAMQSERRQIDAEQRQIDARLSNDCRSG